MDMLYDNVAVQKLGLVDGLVFLLGIGLGQIDVYRHKGTVFLDNLAGTVLVGKLQTILV